MVVNYDNSYGVLNYLNSNQNFDLINNNPFLEPFRDIMPECKYVNIDTLSNNLSKNNSFCMSINCQSLKAKYTALTNLIDDMGAKSIHPSLICCQEIWNSDHSFNNIPGYKFFHESRKKGQGGGAGIYVNKNYHSEKLKKDSKFIENIYESCAIKIDIPKVKKFIAVSLYRPNTHATLTNKEQLDQFFNHLFEHLESLSKYSIPVYFFTDSNIDLLKYDVEENSTLFTDLLSSFGFHQIISKATRISGESYTLIDHIFTSDNCNDITSSGIFIDSISDHYHPFIDINLKKGPRKKNLPRQYRNFSLENKELFKAKLQEQTWNNVLQSNDPNIAANNFHHTFSQIFNSCFPLITEKVNRRYKPINKFMTPGLLKSRRRKIKLANKAKLHPTEENKNNYKRYRNVYISLIRKSKKLLFNSEISAANGDSKKIWKIINENMNNVTNQNPIGPILVNDQLITDNKEMANQFNLHFSSVGKKVAERIPESSNHFTDYLPPPIRNSFFLGPITRLDVIYYIFMLKKKKSQDINEISTELLQYVACPIAAALSHIFTISAQTGIYPEIFKMSKIIPIFKSGDMKDMSCHRGVTITDNISKVFEKIVNDRLTNFLDQNNFFYSHQYGFLKHRSTNHAVIDFINHISDNLNQGNIALGLFMDVEKCFDCISHPILFKKLENAGVRGTALSWFKSFFANRTQKVKIGDDFSENTCNIDISTFQGSVLGVLLFIIFINDVHNCTDAFADLFADDISTITVAKNLNDLMIKANRDLDNLSNWYKANKLSIHPSKSYFMIFSSNKNILSNLPTYDSNIYLPLFINNNAPGESNITKISRVQMVPNKNTKSIRMLGVYLDSNLNLSEHCKHIHGKISRSLYSLNLVKNILNKDCMKLVFNAHVQSHLEYCCNILGMAPEKYLKPLKTVQKKAIRIVCGAAYNEHTPPLFKENNILPLAELIKYNIMKFMLDYKLERLPLSFSDTWIQNNQRGIYALRNAEDFFIPNVRCISFFKHPLYNFSRVYNEMPHTFKNLETNRILNLKKIKEFLLSSI